jgi:hypothetical protein
MNHPIRLKTTAPPLLITLALLCFGLLTRVEAVVPAPDGGYPGQNTAEGQSALLHLAGGTYNTALGWASLGFNVTGNYNTGVGAATLLNNTASENTATGAGALLSNTVGDSNTANGAFALFSNTTGFGNTAVGRNALYDNTSGGSHTAVGYSALKNTIASGDFTGNTAVGTFALFNDTTGNGNVAVGWGAGLSLTTGIGNAATGTSALLSNTEGDANTANGYRSLFNTTGASNTAVGAVALSNNTTGNFNTALGFAAGSNLTTGSGNVCIGADVHGVTGESNTTRIRNIYASMANGRAVYVNSDDKIGTLASSRRFKEGIKPMDKASEVLFALKPVSFRYKKEVDPMRSLSFGLIAEEVARVDPDLVTPDRDGKPETVRYEAVNAMLLNEFLKEHKTVQEQGAIIARQQKQIEALTAGLQKVSAQLAAASPSNGGLEVGKFATGRIRRGGPAPKVVLNNP